MAACLHASIIHADLCSEKCHRSLQISADHARMVMVQIRIHNSDSHTNQRPLPHPYHGELGYFCQRVVCSFTLTGFITDCFAVFIFCNQPVLCTAQLETIFETWYLHKINPSLNLFQRVWNKLSAS